MAGNGSSCGPVLSELKGGIDAGKFTVTSDPPAFLRTLDQAVRDYTRRLT